MIEWSADGLVLAARKHGETGSILDAFTEAQGRVAGLVHGGASRKMAAALQPGSQLALRWRARTDDALGTYTAELRRTRAAVMGDRLALAGLSSACALLAFALPEKMPFPALYAATQTLLDQLDHLEWPQAYLEWEMLLLDQTGFGLDLTECAASGVREDLAYISPRTGRAVSRGGAGIYAHRLLPLPPVLRGADVDLSGIVEGLRVTGHFLENTLAPAMGERPVPEARGRLVGLLERRSR